MNTNIISDPLKIHDEEAAERAALLDEIPKLKADYGELTRLGNPRDESALRQGTALRTRIDFCEQRVVNLENKLKASVVLLESQGNILARRALKILVERREQKVEALAKAIEKSLGGEVDARSIAQAIASDPVRYNIAIPEVFQKLTKAISRVATQPCSNYPDVAEGCRQLLNQIKLAEEEVGEIK